MRGLIICEFYPRDKSDWKGVFIRDYLRALETFCTVDVICTAPQGDTKEYRTDYDGDSKITFHIAANRTNSGLSKCLNISHWYKEIMGIAQGLEKPDFIHVHNSVLQGRVASKMAKEWSIPFFLTEHTGPFSMISGNELKRRQAKSVMQRAQQVFVVSERTKMEISEAGISTKDFIVSYNPVDSETFKRGLDGPHGAIAFVSRMDEFKGAMRTVKAFETLLKTQAGIKLKMVGGGEEYRQVQDYVRKQSLGSSVSLYGAMSKKEIYDVLKRCDMMVFPSRHESFGIVAAEAWSTGIPVITGKDVGAAEIMSQSEINLGEIVDVDDVISLSLAMSKVLSDLDSYNRDEIREYIESRLSVQSFGKLMERSCAPLIKMT